MVHSAEETRFHWLAGDGKQLSGSEHTLRAALTSGAVSASALVWRSGWAEWLPANRVAELAAAIPVASSEGVLKPRRDPSVLTPPPTPAPSALVAPLLPHAPLSQPATPTVTRAPSPSGRAQPPPPPVRAGSNAPPPPVRAKSNAPPPPVRAKSNAPPPPVRARSSAPPPPPQRSAHAAAPVLPADAPPSGGLPPLVIPIGTRREKGAPDPNDTLAPSSFGTIGAPRRAQPAATIVRRDAVTPIARGRTALPTLTEEGPVLSATATLRPPGAVPPPARGVPAVPALDSANPFSFEKRSAVMTPIPSFGPPGGSLETPSSVGAGLPAPIAPEPTRPSTPQASPAADALTPAINEPAVQAHALPPVANKPPPHESTQHAPPHESTQHAPEAIEAIDAPLDSTLEVAPHVPPEARRTPVEPLLAARPQLNSASEDVLARALRRHSLVKIGRIAVDSRTVVMTLSALCGALLVALVALYFARAHPPAPEAVVSATASAPPAPPPVLGCRVTVPAARLASNIERSVAPYAVKVGRDAALALGFAASKTKGVGVRLNPSTLDVLPVFEEEGKDAVRGVVPLTRSGSLAFFVDRDDQTLRAAHTVDEIPPFTLGVSDAGFSRVVAGNTSLVWPLDANVKLTEPRTAAIGSFGYGITFRRGGQTGAVLLGFAAADGSKKSELAEIPGAPKFLGTPVIAGSAAGALVAFAGKDAPEAAWKIFVSLTQPGAAPSAARELITGSGSGAISPALSALAPDRWLVQWTEGSSGLYQVRVQSFAADLKPLGSAVLASPKGANAGQGSLAAFAGGAAALFIQTTAGHDELWGATLSCP